jgi:hypothetical protein
MVAIRGAIRTRVAQRLQLRAIAMTAHPCSAAMGSWYERGSLPVARYALGIASASRARLPYPYPLIAGVRLRMRPLQVSAPLSNEE